MVLEVIDDLLIEQIKASHPRLASLSLRHNALAKLERLEAFPRLTKLDVSGNRITSLEGVVLPRLKSLIIRNNLLTSFEGVQGCPLLEHLDAAENCLAAATHDALLSPLRGLPLATLCLEGNPMLCSSAEAKAVLPSLQSLDGQPCATPKANNQNRPKRAEVSAVSISTITSSSAGKVPVEQSPWLDDWGRPSPLSLPAQTALFKGHDVSGASRDTTTPPRTTPTPERSETSARVLHLMPANPRRADSPPSPPIPIREASPLSRTETGTSPLPPPQTASVACQTGFDTIPPSHPVALNSFPAVSAPRTAGGSFGAVVRSAAPTSESRRVEAVSLPRHEEWVDGVVDMTMEHNVQSTLAFVGASLAKLASCLETAMAHLSSRLESAMSELLDRVGEVTRRASSVARDATLQRAEAVAELQKAKDDRRELLHALALATETPKGEDTTPEGLLSLCRVASSLLHTLQPRVPQHGPDT